MYQRHNQTGLWHFCSDEVPVKPQILSNIKFAFERLGPILKANNHAVVCTHCLVITESNDAYDFILQTATFWVPSLKAKTLVIRTDDLASPDILGKHLSALQLSGLCNFHIRDINLREHVKKHPFCDKILKDFRFILQEARVSIEPV